MANKEYELSLSCLCFIGRNVTKVLIEQNFYQKLKHKFWANDLKISKLSN